MSVLDGLAEAFNAHDLDRIMSYFAEDCSLDLPRGSEPHGARCGGAADVRRGIRTRVETTPDVHYSELEMASDRDDAGRREDQGSRL